MRKRVMDALQTEFRPEFLNRLDEIITFHSLTREHLVQIVDIQLAHLRELLADRKVKVVLTDAAKQKLATDGYDPAYGARPLKRVMQRQLQDPLALAILQGQFSEGDTVHVDAQDDQLTFS
jgi:ATP-dependent Clp protease ATP-binding subunit ClpB